MYDNLKIIQRRIISMKKITIFAAVSFLAGVILTGFVFLYLPETDVNRTGPASASTETTSQLYASPFPAQSMQNPDFVSIAEKISPAVVSIVAERVEQRQVVGFDSPFDDFWDRFFGLPQDKEREYRSRAGGTGFFISAEGFILTNNHIVENAIKVTVTTMQEKEYQAKIIGTDPETDLALLKVETEDHPYAILGDSETLKVGEWVLAVGNPLGLSHTVTSGIVSAKGRFALTQELDYQDFIQTDAAINRGNSGGPLINMEGKVIGINSIIYSPSGGNIGIGFAISSKLAKSVVDQLKEKGRVVRGYLGISIYEITEDHVKLLDLKNKEGAMIAEVTSGSPADKAGLKRYDVITAISGEPVEDGRDLQYKIADIEPGTKTKMTIIRNGKEETVTVEIGEKPSSAQSQDTSDSGKDIGLRVRPMSPALARQMGYKTEEGLLITEVKEFSVAESAGLQRGDVILEINRQKVDSLDDLDNILKRSDAGDPLLLMIRREYRSRPSQDFFVTVRIPE
jgi:serine protease Do